MEYRTTCNSAAICENGHLISGNFEENVDLNYCPCCGAKVIHNCSACGEIIHGDISSNPINHIGMTFTIPIGPDLVPNYCPKCGAPFPWKLANDKASHETLRGLEGTS